MDQNRITVDRLRELVQKFIVLEKDEMENSTEWAYVMLEPALIECEEVTLHYLKHLSTEEFKVLGDNSWFEHILCKFQSVEILDTIQAQYFQFFGDSKDTDFYRDNIVGLINCIKNNK